MAKSIFETRFLINEAQSLLTRLNMVKPFSLTMPMVPAACISDEALRKISNLILVGYKELKNRINEFISQTKSSLNAQAEVSEIQSRFTILKLRFNALLDQFDIFADVLSQRSEHETGVWVAGLDALAEDGLKIKGNYYEAPPLICFLERGHGAAIRKARSRLPGGDFNPVGVIQVPRERMVGSGIASSLIHEVGHQGAALLNLVESLREQIRIKQLLDDYPKSWECYYRWISEIIADFWAMANLGIGATMGLMSVVSLPTYFVFRVNLNDPHPFPWIRVKLSLAFGKALYPHPQWQRIDALWERMYPRTEASRATQELLEELELTMPVFANMIINHRPVALRGTRLIDIFYYKERQPAQLQYLFNLWRFSPDEVSKAPPVLLFAVIGQARVDANITSQKESQLLGQWLTSWAFRRSESRSRKEFGKISSELKQIVNN